MRIIRRNMRDSETARRHIAVFVVFLFAFASPPFLATCRAEGEMLITAERMSYDVRERTYTLEGNVVIERGDTVIRADSVIYREQTADIAATGHVRYEDPDLLITADEAELNLDKKTGALIHADILFKEENCRISAPLLRRTGGKDFSGPEATFTTCDPPAPAWSFRGKDVHAVLGSTIVARNVAFRIKDIPVLYTPVFLAPILTERTTGLLIPTVSYSDARGFQLALPFYLVIAENQDATFVLDGYSKRGLGTGIEYRYVWPERIQGTWWGYAIRDRKLVKDFFEVRSRHSQRSATGVGGYLTINYVNEKEYFREFKTDLVARTNRFLESTGEITIPFSRARAYLLSQYWIDLKPDSPDPAQRLPEAGFVLNPMPVGPFMVSGATSVAHFSREDGASGQRIDFFPRITHSFGNDFVVLQSIGLRETAYALRHYNDNAIHRESLEYRIATHCRFVKRYASVTHALEPTIGYTHIVNSEEDLPLFDSAELSRKTSTADVAIVNRLFSDRGEEAVFRISQGIDFSRGDRPFLPTALDIGLRRPLPLRVSALLDVHAGEIEQLNSDITVSTSGVTVTAGQRYRRLNDVNTIVAGVSAQPLRRLSVKGGVWYDAEEWKAREISLTLTYLSGCWGINVGFVKRPDDFSVSFLVELKGITKALTM